MTEKRKSKKVPVSTKSASKKVVKKTVFEPLRSKLLITRNVLDDEEQRTGGGLIIPQESREPPSTAVVVSVGPLVQGIRPGNTIVVDDFCGAKVILEDEEFTVIEEEDVLGIYK